MTLSQAFDALVPFLRAHWLVSADSDESQIIEPSLRAADWIANYQIIACRHLVEDTELYQVRTSSGALAALKLARHGAQSDLASQFVREAEALEIIAGAGAPRLLSKGTFKDHPFLAMSWFAGGPVTRTSTELRQIHGASSDPLVFDLCKTALHSYAGLHAAGVVHGDVNPRNVLAN